MSENDGAQLIGCADTGALFQAPTVGEMIAERDRAWAKLLVARVAFWRDKEGDAGPSAGELADRCRDALAELKALGVDVEALARDAFR